MTLRTLHNTTEMFLKLKIVLVLACFTWARASSDGRGKDTFKSYLTY